MLGVAGAELWVNLETLPGYGPFPGAVPRMAGLYPSWFQSQLPATNPTARMTRQAETERLEKRFLMVHFLIAQNAVRGYLSPHDRAQELVDARTWPPSLREIGHPVRNKGRLRLVAAARIHKVRPDHMGNAFDDEHNVRQKQDRHD